MDGATLGVRDSGEEEDECPPLKDQGEDDSDDESDDDSVAESVADGDGEMEPEAPEPRHSERIKGGVAKPKKYAMTTERNRKQGRAEKVKAAKVAEIKQVFDELEAL